MVCLSLAASGRSKNAPTGHLLLVLAQLATLALGQSGGSAFDGAGISDGAGVTGARYHASTPARALSRSLTLSRSSSYDNDNIPEGHCDLCRKAMVSGQVYKPLGSGKCHPGCFDHEFGARSGVYRHGRGEDGSPEANLDRHKDHAGWSLSNYRHSRDHALQKVENLGVAAKEASLSSQFTGDMRRLMRSYLRFVKEAQAVLAREHTDIKAYHHSNLRSHTKSQSLTQDGVDQANPEFDASMDKTGTGQSRANTIQYRAEAMLEAIDTCRTARYPCSTNMDEKKAIVNFGGTNSAARAALNINKINEWIAYMHRPVQHPSAWLNDGQIST